MEKKEIVIDLRDGGDWSLDLCFAGLRQNLGADNVWDIPWKKKHREWAGVVQGLIEPDWGLERRTLGYTPQDDDRIGNWIQVDPSQVKRIWLDERMESFNEYRRKGFYDAKVPVVVVAGHDRFWNQSPQFVANLYGERLQAMLLDNWYPEYARLPFRVGHVRWSCNFDHYWTRPKEPRPKEYDICFVGYNSHPDRARFISHIERNWDHLNNFIQLERRPDTVDSFLSKEMLFSVMQRSRICLNLRGAADRGKTLRAYEIPYVGSFMLSQRIDDPGLMQDFREDVECAYFDDEDSLDANIANYLEDETNRELVAKSGHEHTITNLTAKARWGAVVRWLDDAGPS